MTEDRVYTKTVSLAHTMGRSANHDAPPESSSTLESSASSSLRLADQAAPSCMPAAAAQNSTHTGSVLLALSAGPADGVTSMASGGGGGGVVTTGTTGGSLTWAG